MTIPVTAAHGAFTLPVILPASEGIREVTHDEIHALELGFIVGIASAWLYAIGRTEIIGTIVVGSLGYKRYSSKAFKTVRKEPWYELIALAMGGSLDYWIFMAEPGLIQAFQETIEPYLPRVEWRAR